MFNGGSGAAVDNGAGARCRRDGLGVDDLPAGYRWGWGDRGHGCGCALGANQLTVPRRGWHRGVAAGIGAGQGVVEPC